MIEDKRIVITGIGLTAPNGNSLHEFRSNLLSGNANIQEIDMRYIGKVPAGICNYETTKYQSRKELRVGTRAGSIAIYCANEALKASSLNLSSFDKDRIGIYIGTTEHGNVETENEIHNISKFNYDTRFWTHHHNPRTVANNPAGEVSINLGITGPHYTIGAACAAGNAGLIQAVQMLKLNEIDFAIAGGVSESIHTFGIFAGFKSQGALAKHENPNRASRPFDKARNGIVVSEGGCLYTLERLDSAIKRGAPIIAEIIGYCMNSDASDYVLPNPIRQAECMKKALISANLKEEDIDLISTHATSTPQGDIQECLAIKEVFKNCKSTYINNTKGFIGHAMGAAGALELAGNLPSFEDNIIHPTINIDDLDLDCKLNNLIINQSQKVDSVEILLNNSFGMLGINSTLILKKFNL